MLIVYTFGFAALGTGTPAGPRSRGEVGRNFDRGLLAGITPN